MRAAVCLRAAAADRTGLRVVCFRAALFVVVVLRGRLVVCRAERTVLPRAAAVFFFAFPREVVAFFCRLWAAPPVLDRLEARALLRLREPAGLRLRVEDVFRPLAV